MNPQAAVLQFHRIFGVEIRQTPVTSIPEGLHILRLGLHEEEHSELVDAFNRDDVVEVADALADIVYIAYGTAVSLGIDLDKVLEEVHRSNISKLNTDGSPIYREDGKVLKGPNYTPPDVRKVLYG